MFVEQHVKLEGHRESWGGNVTVTSTKITYEEVAKNATDFLRLVVVPRISIAGSVCETAVGHGER